ncbi:O-antigen ligase family protein [Propionibacteriaceae bacterium G57]|uniref:O-antigen ligase family protein n=1 Tax=Aestuariimicrobium sp. G57 TaxID=3418485 RepID=UPI003DA755B5
MPEQPTRRERVLDRIENAALVCWPMLVLVALYLPSGLASPHRLVVALLLACAALRIVWRPVLWRSPALWGALVVGAGFAVFGLVGLRRYPHLSAGVELGQVAFLVLALVAMSIVGRRTAAIFWLIGGWCIAGVAASAVGIWETVTNCHLSVNAPGAYWGQRAATWKINSAFFDNPNLYAYFLAVLMALVVLAGFAASALPTARRRAAGRVAAVVGFLVLAHQLYMTDGRAGMLAVALLVLGLLLRSWWGRGLVAAGALAFWVGVRVGFGPAVSLWAAIYEVYDQADEAPRSTWIRVQLVRSAWHMLRQSDWIGVGPGGYPLRNMLPDNPINVWNMPNPHSGIVEVMAEYGLVTVSLLMLALLVAAVACVVMSVRRRGLDRRAGVGEFVSRWSPTRTTLAITAILAVSVPVVSLAHSTWLRQPLTALHLATLVGLVTWGLVSWRGSDHPADPVATTGQSLQHGPDDEREEQ